YQPLSACFTASPNPGICPATISFDASCSIGSSFANYSWNFGCGGCTASGPAKTAQYTYQAAGTYPVMLTVTDDDAQTASQMVNVTVNTNAVAPTSVTAIPNNFCQGTQSQVTLGASGGFGTNIEWFDGSCGGNLIGTGGNVIVAAPPSPKTYFA